MSSYHRLAGFASVAALLAGGSLGCVHDNGLALKRVIIYRNGVGYFERAGRVNADEVTFRVRAEKVGDFLATLAVIEKGGSSVRSASFPLEHKEDDDDEVVDEAPTGDRRLDALVKAPSVKKGPKKDGLDTVTLALDGDRHDLIVGYVAETPVWRPSYRLVVTGKGSGAGKAI